MKKSLPKIILLIFFLVTGLQNLRSQDITTGLVAHYEFENTTGDVIDAAGSHNGTNNGATRGVAGKIGNAFSFDGSSYVTIDSHSDITNYSAFTLSAWVYPTTLGSHNTIVSKVTPNRDFDLKFWGTTTLQAHYASGSTYYSCNSQSTASTNQWIHVAATWQNNQWNIYYNGVLDNTCNVSAGPPWTGGTMQIGAMGGGERFVGVIDEVRIYSRALSSTDVSALYSYTGGTSIPSLSLNDATANENDSEVTFTLSLSQPATSPFTYTVSTSDGTAIAGSDYVSNSHQYTWQAGTSGGIMFGITPIDDDIAETDETFTVSLSNVSGATIGDGTGVGTIIDNDMSGGLTCSNTVSTYPYSEGFESAPNTWENRTGDDIDWTRHSGATGSSSTGPSAAQEGTYYNYIEASSPNSPSKTAVLYGPCFDLSGQSQAEFSFFYHMYGSNMGTLKLEASTDGSTWNTLWTLSGDQGNSWAQATANLGSYLGNIVQLRFYGTTGSGYRSDMAVDNLSLNTTSGGGSAVTSVNSYTGNVQLNLGLSNDNLSISGGNTIALPYGVSDITGITGGTGISGGGSSGSITLNAENSSAIWNANKLQGRSITTTNPSLGQVLKWNGSAWAPGTDEGGTGGSSLWLQSGSNIYFNTGNVGIGTSVPDQKLTVAGKIHAQEVIVDLNIDAPDYVFEKGYKLRGLAELEKYLTTNNHLPDIPSAKELETNGVTLSHMNMMLLKRIEELTLYIIDQEKRLKDIEESKESQK